MSFLRRAELMAKYGAPGFGALTIALGLADSNLPMMAGGAAFVVGGAWAFALAGTRLGSWQRRLATRTAGAAFIACGTLAFLYRGQVQDSAYGPALAYIVAPLLAGCGMWLLVTGRDSSHLSADSPAEIIREPGRWLLKEGERNVVVMDSDVLAVEQVPPSDERNPTHGMPDDAQVHYVLVRLTPGLTLSDMNAPPRLAWLESEPGELLIPEPLIARP